jgi:hypothetical protein
VGKLSSFGARSTREPRALFAAPRRCRSRSRRNHRNRPALSETPLRTGLMGRGRRRRTRRPKPERLGTREATETCSPRSARRPRSKPQPTRADRQRLARGSPASRMVDPMHSLAAHPASDLPLRPYLPMRSTARETDSRARRRHAPTGTRCGRRSPDRRASARPAVTVPASPVRDATRCDDTAGSRDVGAHGDDPPPRRPLADPQRPAFPTTPKQIARSPKIVVRKRPPERA